LTGIQRLGDPRRTWGAEAIRELPPGLPLDFFWILSLRNGRDALPVLPSPLLFIDRQLRLMGIDVNIIGIDTQQEFSADTAVSGHESGFEADGKQQERM
jgi:hypothetical protein